MFYVFFREKIKKPNMFYVFLFYRTKNGFQEWLPNWLHFFSPFQSHSIHLILNMFFVVSLFLEQKTVLKNCNGIVFMSFSPFQMHSLYLILIMNMFSVVFSFLKQKTILKNCYQTGFISLDLFKSHSIHLIQYT